MIYQLDDEGFIIKEFENLWAVSQKLKVSKSWLYDQAKGNKGKSFKVKEFVFIREEDYDAPIKIGDNNFRGNDGNYHFHNDTYSWTSKGKTFYLLQERADKLFFEFSKHGLDLTQNEVRLRNNIGIHEWHVLKGRLQLFKSSDIFAPETRKSLTDEEYRKIAREKIHELNAYRKRAVIDEYNDFHIKNAKKWRDQANRNIFKHESFLTEITDWLESQKSKEHIHSSNMAATQQPLVVATADWHFGAGIKSQYTNPEYNPQVVEKLVDKLTSQINEKMSKDVTLILDGDFIESWMGLNHIDSWKGIDAGHFGALVVEKVIEQLFEPLLKKTNNLKTVIGVGGNHDRGTNSNKEDNMAQIATIIFYILSRLYPKLNFEYDPYCMSFDKHGLHYIIQHGYFQAPYKGKQDGDSLVNDYGSKDLFNVVLTADKHTRGVLMDSFNRRHIKIPPMFTGNFYSTSKGYSSVSGCLFIEQRDGFPIVTDHSFYSRFNENIFKK